MPQSSFVGSVRQILMHWCVTLEQTWFQAHGHASPCWPVPGFMQVVVPSSRTTMHAVSPLQRHSLPLGQGKGTSRLQASAGTHTGTRGDALLLVSDSAKRSGRSAQKVPEVQVLFWPQQ
jgi:hypothetical protein